MGDEIIVEDLPNRGYSNGIFNGDPLEQFVINGTFNPKCMVY